MQVSKHWFALLQVKTSGFVTSIWVVSTAVSRAMIWVLSRNFCLGWQALR